MKSRAALAVVVAAALTATIWALSIPITGKSEPWDAEPPLETVDNPSGPGRSDSAMLMAAFERPGTYAITVSKAGYRDFAINNVVVTAGVCHVNTVTVEARLST